MTTDGDKEPKPQLIHDDRNLLFAQRYGYLPLPDVMDYRLCKEFRDSLYRELNIIVPVMTHDYFDEYILRKYAISVKKETEASYWENLKYNYNSIYSLDYIVYNDEFHEVLSFCEIFLCAEDMDSVHKDRIRDVFKQRWAPYAIDDSAEPPCIIPLDTPENAAAVVGTIETLHKDGRTNGHQSLRDAAGQINGGDYKGGARSAVDALESVAKDVAGDRSATLSDAIETLKKGGFLKDRPRLHQGLDKLWGFASETVRHGNKSKATTEPIDRNEAVLIFCLCASLSAYLSRAGGENDE